MAHSTHRKTCTCPFELSEFVVVINNVGIVVAVNNVAIIVVVNNVAIVVVSHDKAGQETKGLTTTLLEEADVARNVLAKYFHTKPNSVQA